MIKAGVFMIWCFGLTVSPEGLEVCEVHGKIEAPSITACEDFALQSKDEAWKRGYVNNKVYCIAIQEL